MQLNRKSVELLAPAGTWDALAAVSEAGADAVYLGGKHFNMRVHNDEMNFSNEALKRAVDYTHERGIKLYITLNNLISDEEIAPLKEYLSFLQDLQPDAILVQDTAVIKLVRDMGIKIPMHASVMMNIHNVAAIETLKSLGITRVVASRETTLSELMYWREHTGIEIEYFMHGDMCIAEGGQCIHSGVLFGQSGNRGRCLKPCRWPYKLIDAQTGEDAGTATGDHKLALKDMCMYRDIPALVQSGVYSFKVEGRMRPAEFLKPLVGLYRRAIDSYLADPTGWQVPEEDWQKLYKSRVRGFSTVFAFGQPTEKDIGFSGKREPRFFSSAVKEAGFQDDILKKEAPINKAGDKRRLSVRVASPAAAEAALMEGADAIYIGGEVYRPLAPWKLADIERTTKVAHRLGAKAIVMTPRTTTRRELGELRHLFAGLMALSDKPDGLLVSNLGSLRLATELTSLPVQTDLSFNLFNHLAADFLQGQGAVMGASSLELSFSQLRSLVEKAALPIETVIHGSYESMICDHFFPALNGIPFNPLENPELLDKAFALKDEAGELHALKVDQYGRTHILFAKDLCLYPYLAKFNGLASYRIEAQDYEPELVALVTKTYRKALDDLNEGKEPDKKTVYTLSAASPRVFGIGTYRFRESRNS